jgi:6-pyruvoyltetrahydropterin/6-carboxytetrahydropterin synthase
MIIRKLFKFENAHIVRNCTSKMCRASLHGHSYKAEILLESNFLDNGQMIYDFGLMKNHIKDIISSFDHSVSIWNRDDPAYILAMKEHSERWIILPVSPSAEQLSRVIFILIDKYLKLSQMVNGEKNVKLYSVIIHETDTGYAQCFRDDAFNENMGDIDIMNIVFSDEVQNSWNDRNLYQKLINNLPFTNPTTI